MLLVFKTEEEAPRSDYMDRLKYFLVFEKRHAALTQDERHCSGGPTRHFVGKYLESV